MNDVVVTNYCFGPLYGKQQERLKESITKLYPQINIKFWKDEERRQEICDLNKLPPGARTNYESCYGFKVHAIKACLDEGYKKIIWADSAMIFHHGLEDIIEKRLSKEGVICCHGDQRLINCISDSCLSAIGKTKNDIEHLSLIAGSIYLFDFNHPVTQKFFDKWYDMEKRNLFGRATDPQLLPGFNNHGADETCFALCLDEVGLKPLKQKDLGYYFDPPPIPTHYENGTPIVFQKHHDIKM